MNSYDSEDVKQIKGEGTLGKDAIQTIVKRWRQQGAYDKTYSESPTKAAYSQGVRVSY